MNSVEVPCRPRLAHPEPYENIGDHAGQHGDRDRAGGEEDPPQTEARTAAADVELDGAGVVASPQDLQQPRPAERPERVANPDEGEPVLDAVADLAREFRRQLDVVAALASLA